jgi:hypothetical protein
MSMDFIKRNLFLAIVVGVVAVGGMALVLLAGSIAPDDAVKERLDLSKRLEQRAGRSLVARTSLQAQREEVQKLIEQADSKVRELIKFNRGQFKVPMLPVPVDGKVEEFAAFPVDPQRYERFGMYYVFTQQYVDDMAKLRGELKAVTPPTEAELRKRIRDKGGAAPAADDPAMLMVADGKDDIRKKALDELRLEKACAGEVYVADDSFDMFFPEPSVAAVPAERLWGAMLNKWVQQEIVGAIRQTNEEVLKGRQVCVMNSAVKRLIKVEVIEEYARSDGQDTGGGKAIYRQGLPASPPCKDYDVVRYAFSVVMPSRHVLALSQNLMKRNLHTVLHVDMATPAEVKPGVSSQYIYGPEAVMEVTISAELKLLTEWTRGMYDKSAKQWIDGFPPLTPKETLRLLPKEALREEDVNYISK